MERLCQALSGVLRLAAITLQPLLGFQVATLAGFGVFFGVSCAGDMVYSCILLGSLAVVVCPGVRGPCPCASVSTASRFPRTSCFLLATMCGINAPEWPVLCPYRLLYAALGEGGWAMTFEEILDQAIAMLQRRGRLTYSTLKRQFQLDDAALEDLKNELIEGQRLAVDERGNVLVWTGGADAPQLRPSPPTADVQPIQGHPPPDCPSSSRRGTTATHRDVL